MFRLAVAALLLAGCSETPTTYTPAAYRPPLQLQNTVTPFQPVFNESDFQAPKTTWCRPDGYGGVWCS